MDEIILKYKDTVLRVSDLSILQGPCYLNDQVIAFYFEYLSSIWDSNDHLLIAPSISFWLANCPDETLDDFVKPLDLSRKTFVLFPINDNDDVTAAESGSHWSLLVYDRSKNGFVHLDSMGGANRAHAMKLYKAVKRFVVLESESFDASMVSFEECKTPQESNGYDCGIYVIAFARVICEWYTLQRKDKDGDTDWLYVVQNRVDESVEMTMRVEIMKLVEDLKKDQR